MCGIEPRKMTWAVLLGRWVEFARSAVALPTDARGRAWRDAVPEIIGLQAVTMALGEMEGLSHDERALGLDRARILIERHSKKLHRLFPSDELHPMLVELMNEAKQAVEKAEHE